MCSNTVSVDRKLERDCKNSDVGAAYEESIKYDKCVRRECPATASIAALGLEVRQEAVITPLSVRVRHWWN